MHFLPLLHLLQTRRTIHSYMSFMQRCTVCPAKPQPCISCLNQCFKLIGRSVSMLSLSLFLATPAPAERCASCASGPTIGRWLTGPQHMLANKQDEKSVYTER